MALGVINSLKKSQDALNALDKTIMPEKAGSETLSFAEEYSRNGKITGGFIRVFVQNAPTAWKTQLCAAFKANFGLDGFPEIARTGSCD